MSFFIHIMTIHTTLHKLPVSLSQSQWSSIVDTRSVPSLLVPSPLDGVLYAEAGWPAYLLEIQTSCYSENRYQSVLWQRIIPIKGESFPPGGSHSRQGGVISALGVNDRGVTHAGESFTPLTPVTSLLENKATRAKYS